MRARQRKDDDSRLIFCLAFGAVLHEERVALRLSQETLASDLGWSQASISRMERGTLLPDVYEMSRLSSKLRTRSNALLEMVVQVQMKVLQAVVGRTIPASKEGLRCLAALAAMEAAA